MNKINAIAAPVASLARRVAVARKAGEWEKVNLLMLSSKERAAYRRVVKKARSCARGRAVCHYLGVAEKRAVRVLNKEDRWHERQEAKRQNF